MQEFNEEQLKEYLQLTYNFHIQERRTIHHIEVSLYSMVMAWHFIFCDNIDLELIDNLYDYVGELLKRRNNYGR